jgi:hypothetical protein
MKALELALKKTPLVYVTRDIERALGLPETTKNYFIVTNSTPFGKMVAKKRKGVLLIKNKELLDTRDLLIRPETERFLKRIKNFRLVVFKNTGAIEQYCAKKNWPLLNPPAELASTIEEKITQVEWLGSLSKYLPSHQILPCKKIRFTGKKFILQFNRAHTGSGTMLIESKKQLTEIQKQFPDRPARVTDYIDGLMFTNNNVVCPKGGYIGNISFQITGLWPFTERPFATIGNDWGFPPEVLTDKLTKEYNRLVQSVGEKLRRSGWKGLFGIDVMIDLANKKLFLIEINARQPASTTYESLLQLRQGIPPSETVFGIHLLSLLGEQPPLAEQSTRITGSQVIAKVTNFNKKNKTRLLAEAKKIHGTVITYTNTEPESDFLRMQFPQAIFTSLEQLEATQAASRIGKEKYSKKK